MLTFLPSHGQGLQFGLQLGSSFSYMHGNFVTTAADDVSITLSPKLASRFSGGAYFRYYITPAFSIQPELLYTTKGGRIRQDVDFQGQDMRFDGNLMMKYINLPLLFRLGTYNPPPEPPGYSPPGYTYHVLAGASMAYNTDARLTGNLSGNFLESEFSEQFTRSVQNQFRNNDFSVIVGAGFEYGRHTRFTFDIRYELSVQDISNDDATSDELRNGTITAMIGILF
ncbi:MAG: porin family protein [Cyclonatronaceae bacterium]